MMFAAFNIPKPPPMETPSLRLHGTSTLRNQLGGSKLGYTQAAERRVLAAVARNFIIAKEHEAKIKGHEANVAEVIADAMNKKVADEAWEEIQVSEVKGILDLKESFKGGKLPAPLRISHSVPQSHANRRRAAKRARERCDRAYDINLVTAKDPIVLRWVMGNDAEALVAGLLKGSGSD